MTGRRVRMLPWDPLWRLRHVGYPVSPRGYRGLPAFASLSMAGSDGLAAAALNPKPASFAAGAFRLDTDGDGQTGTDTDLANVIKNGGGKYGGNPAMPGRADFSDAEIANLVAYIHTLKK